VDAKSFSRTLDIGDCNRRNMEAVMELAAYRNLNYEQLRLLEDMVADAERIAHELRELRAVPPWWKFWA
jgi:hypothetical protein